MIYCCHLVPGYKCFRMHKNFLYLKNTKVPKIMFLNFCPQLNLMFLIMKEKNKVKQLRQEVSSCLAMGKRHTNYL
jgi:hypothetical protein